MKFVSLLLLSSSLVSSQFIVTEKEPSLKEIISNNIDIFNLPEENGKVRTYFNEVSSSLDVYDKNKNKFGEIIIFDNNEGYLFYSLNNEIIKESYDEGIPFSYQELKEKVIYSNNCYMDMSYNVIYDLSISQNYAGGLNEKFHSHVDESFTKEKNRIMLTEWDSKYYTKVDIESCKFKNKITWSTEQGNTLHCVQIAFANLFWTYKINNIVDLTNNAASSSELEKMLTKYLEYDNATGTKVLSIPNITNYIKEHYPDSGYYIDYIDVTNGISDNLKIAPIVGSYSYNNEGHAVLVTGKGKSLHKKVLGVSIWTSWDIVNSWSGYNTPYVINGNLYPSYKYWIDNQYIYWGFALRDKKGNAVSLL